MAAGMWLKPHCPSMTDADPAPQSWSAPGAGVGQWEPGTDFIPILESQLEAATAIWQASQQRQAALAVVFEAGCLLLGGRHFRPSTCLRLIPTSPACFALRGMLHVLTCTLTTRAPCICCCRVAAAAQYLGEVEAQGLSVDAACTNVELHYPKTAAAWEEFSTRFASQHAAAEGG